MQISANLLKSIWPVMVLVASAYIIATYVPCGGWPSVFAIVLVLVVLSLAFWQWKGVSRKRTAYDFVANEWIRLGCVFITGIVFMFIFSMPEIALRNDKGCEKVSQYHSYVWYVEDRTGSDFYSKEFGEAADNVDPIKMFYGWPRDFNAKSEMCNASCDDSRAGIRKVFEDESMRAGNEIAKRMDHIDEWFHYKFILVGALIAAFLTPFVQGRKPNVAELEKVLKSIFCCVVLSLACIIAFAVDIHIRNDAIAINQLGNWLAHYAEPFLSDIPFFDTSVMFWEKFLRQEESGMHTDPLYRLTFQPHLHFLTWIIYAFYLWVFQNMCLTDERKKSASKRQSTRFQMKNDTRESPNAWIVLGSYGLVQISVLAFALMTTTSPSQFQLRPIPGVTEWTVPWVAMVVYGCEWLILIAIEAPYIALLLNRCHTSRGTHR